MKNSLEGKRILITGANGGIAKYVIKQLIELKPEAILLAARTEEKAKSVIEQLSNKGDTLIAAGGFDMNSPKSIKSAVECLNEFQAFDIVFLQARGMVVGSDYSFIDGPKMRFEKTAHQNTIGAYLTYQALMQNNLISDNARIVFAGGEGARGIKGMIKKPVFKSDQELVDYLNNGNSKYKDIDSLGTSKFFSALLVQKLATIDPSRSYLWFSPGLTALTKGLDDVKNPKKFIMERIGFPIMMAFGMAQHPKKAAAKYVKSLTGEIGNSGELLGAPEGKTIGRLVDQKPMNSGLTNQSLISAFWEIIELNFGKTSAQF